MSNSIQGVGIVMILIGIFTMFSSLQQAMISFYQVLILGAMFFGLGIVVCSVGILNNSIKKQTEILNNSLDKIIKK
jgi:hypothetical protein